MVIKEYSAVVFCGSNQQRGVKTMISIHTRWIQEGGEYRRGSYN